MIINQLSVKVKNKPGELSKISDVLGDNGINARAITAVVHGKEAWINLVADDEDKANEVITGAGYTVVKKEVIAVETPDHPGGLNAILRPLKDAKINVEYLYPAIGKKQKKAVMIIGAYPIKDAVAALEKSYIKILGEEIHGL